MKNNARLICLLFVFLIGAVQAFGQHYGRLQPSDIEYIGAYGVPSHQHNQANTKYGFQAFTFCEEDRLFYASGNGGQNRVYAFTLPDSEPVMGFSNLPKGTVKKRFHNCVGPLGSKDLHDTYSHLFARDIYVRGGNLYASLGHIYNVRNKNYPHYVRSPASLDGSSVSRDPPAHYGDFNGAWYLTDDDGKKYSFEAIAGWMTPIPHDIARDYYGGRDVLCGNSTTWRAGASNGPSAHAVDLTDFKRPDGTWKHWKETAPATHILSYVGGDGVAGPSYWTGSNQVAAGLIVKAGDRVGMLFFGRQGDPSKRRTYHKRWEFLWRFGYETQIAPSGNQGYRADFPPTDEEVAAATDFSTYEEALAQWREVRPPKEEVHKRSGLSARFAYVLEHAFIPKPKVPLRNSIWWYPLDENGQTTAEPYHISDITDLTYPHGYRQLTGLGWDGEKQRIYVCQALGAREAVIHVWQVKSSPQPLIDVTIRLKASEYDSIRQRATSEGVSVEQWIRNQVIDE